MASAVDAIRRHVAEEPHDLVGVLEHFVEDMVELHSKNPRLQHVLLDEAPRPPHLKARLQELEQAAVGSSEILLRANLRVRVENHRTAAYLAVQSIETLVHRFVVEPTDDVSRERFAAELVEMLVRYLGKNRSANLEFRSRTDGHGGGGRGLQPETGERGEARPFPQVAPCRCLPHPQRATASSS